jgi:nitrite reductase/ring-hydroxylating ferredoxin subunit
MTYPRPVMSPGETLCLLSDLADPGSREFRIATERGPRFAFIVRKGDAVYGYMNRCPHIGATMDYKIDEFLTRDRQRIECSYHGAEFRIEDGFCVLGPCEGLKLTPVALRLEDGRVILAP